MFNRKKPVGHSDEHPARNPAKLAYQKQLICHTTRMLEYSVGCRYLEAAVIKRQLRIRLDLNVADAGEGALELKAGTKPASSNVALMGVASFKHVRAVADHIGYAQVENLICRQGAHPHYEISENALASSKQQALSHAVRRDLAVILCVCQW